MWGLPGGHAESGESMLGCARRELRADTEHDASDLRFLCSFDDTDEYGAAYLVTFFWYKYDGIQPLAFHEGQALAFFTRSAAENYPIPAYLFDVWDGGFAVGTITTTTETHP